ncbi:MAG TPA: PLP-dependent transferase, partial [Candidatus Omnitrophota bacterium]|nr:PLP-dependent transferase [Candidatus Omnitrophota bacterium]
MSLPRWADVVAYEEGEQETLHAMSCGYPRFFLHPLYHQLRRTFAAAARPGEAVWVFPSAQVAWACVAHVGAGRVATAGGGVALVLVPDALQAKVKEFWQHTGMIVSSRLADAILANRPAGSADALTRLRGLVAEYNGVGADDIHLAPSGMGAIHQAHLAVTAVRAGHPVQLGFPYIDTLKLLQKFGGGAYFPYNSADDIEPLAAAVGGGAVSAVFCEVPGNPLLRTIDLARLCAILRPQGVPLVVDDT